MTAAELRDHLVRLGGVQAAVARAVGCGRTTLRRWFNGAAPIPARAAECIRGLIPPLPPKPKLPQDGTERGVGRPKNVQAMTVAELAQHKARVGGHQALCRALPCAGTTLRGWSAGQVNVSAAWAERIRALPDAAAPHVDDRQLPFPFLNAEAARP